VCLSSTRAIWISSIGSPLCRFVGQPGFHLGGLILKDLISLKFEFIVIKNIYISAIDATRLSPNKSLDDDLNRKFW
jgi:hypothetical protein